MTDTTPSDGVTGGPPDAAAQAMADACAREEIQFLGHVQDFGCLLVVTTQWVVRNASANCGAILGLDADALISQRLTDVLPGSTLHTLRGKVQVMGRNDQGIRLFDIDVFEDGRSFDIAIHADEGVFLIEFEHKRPDRVRAPGAVVQSLMPRLVRAEDQDQLCMIATDAVWAMTGFDRVMVYRFDADFSGIVVAETLSGAADSYLDHRFPASDIPPQARALYRRNLIRIIADVDAPVHPIIPPQTPSGGPTDLSLSVTRAVSPIHLEYLRNMGVRSSMSASILVDGKLWGMIACHHPQPHYIDYETRSAIELFAQLLAYELVLREKREEASQTAAAMDAQERLSVMFESATTGTPDLAVVAAEIGGVIDADGIALMLAGRYHASGRLQPGRETFVALMDHVARNGTSRIFTTDHLAHVTSGLVSPDLGIGGMLAIPIHSRRGDGVILFRKELAGDIVWAGQPVKTQRPDGRLSPRNSFAAWHEERRGFSESWSAADRAAAEVLRVSLLEITLRLSTDRDRRTTSRSDRQEIVIAELTHRLRNVYATVSAAISSSADQNEPVLSAFVAEIHARLAAMKRAGDVLTERKDQPTSLCHMIQNEVRAYGTDTGDRVDYTGPDVLLSSRQRSALTLVIHELTTNAVKYGALRSPGGRIGITVTERKGGVELDWRETGGPPVVPPQRTGFGSALIEQVIPHEMGGRVAVSFAPEGFGAVMYLPGLKAGPAAPAGPLAAPAPDAVPQVRLTGRALVVEDNAIIAMNAAQSLRRLGADDVVIAATPDAAISALEDGPPFAFAVLDQDLNGVSSESVALRLEEAGVPFVMASGLVPHPDELKGVFARAVWIEKPYSNEAIGQTLGDHFADRFARGGAQA